MPPQTWWRELTELDEKLLGGGSDFVEAARLLELREAIIQSLSATAETSEELDELMARNRRLTEWLLHYRRVALIESAALDQHLRFLERAGEPILIGAQFEAIG